MGATNNWQRIVVLPRNEPSTAVALSPDGTFAALDVTTFGPYMTMTSMIEVREVESAKVIASYTLPTVSDKAWALETKQVQYCDSGKYLLVSDRVAHIVVLDTKTYQPHFSIDLDGISSSVATTGATSMSSVSVWSACAASGKIAILYLTGGKFGWGTIKVVDLETAGEIPGMEGTSDAVKLTGMANFTSVAVSPSGWWVAMLAGDSVLVVDLRTRSVSQTISLRPDEFPNPNRVSFAGDFAIYVSTYPSVEKPFTRLWDVRTGSEIRAFGDTSDGAYGSFGVSADGHTVFGYTEKISICATCRNGNGSSRAKLAHFTLWNRDTGTVIAQSPAIRLIHHRCWTVLWGAREDFDEGPDLEISQTGKVVAVTWQAMTEPVRIFRLK